MLIMIAIFFCDMNNVQIYNLTLGPGENSFLEVRGDAVRLTMSIADFILSRHCV